MKIPKRLPFPPFLAVAILAAAVFRRLNNPPPQSSLSCLALRGPWYRDGRRNTWLLGTPNDDVCHRYPLERSRYRSHIISARFRRPLSNSG